MMPNPRFSFGDGDDDRLIESADSLKVHLYRREEGRLCIHFELSGDIGFEDDDDGGAVAPKIDLGFVRELIAKFERVRE
jgi:hypothetical protein